jgi:hypothetical protein
MTSKPDKFETLHLAPLLAYLDSCLADAVGPAHRSAHRLAEYSAGERGSTITEDIDELFDLDPSHPWFAVTT